MMFLMENEFRVKNRRFSEFYQKQAKLYVYRKLYVWNVIFYILECTPI